MKVAISDQAVSVTGRTLGGAILFYLFLLSPHVAAETIAARLGSGITVSAKFHRGVPSQPAVMLVHGFAQTHHSEPMRTLANNLAAAGYTTLNPTISLGINKRSQIMGCETAHTHSMAQEAQEITHWAEWLGRKGYKNIVLVGFSSGNNEVLEYIAQEPHPHIRKSILISPSPIVHDGAEIRKIRALTAEPQKHLNKQKLERYSLGYCKKNYAATAHHYLSYTRYDERKMMELIKQTPLPAEIIMGSQDSILSANWMAQIKTLNKKVKIIDEADHFFSDMYESDLTEEVENILKNIPAQ